MLTIGSLVTLFLLAHYWAAAGVIMAIAFFGMLTSTQAVLNQLSLFLVVAVLLDTFVVRILLVPPMMRLLGEANYWPRYAKHSRLTKANDVTDVETLSAST